MFNGPQTAVLDAILNPATPFLAVETTPGSGLIQVLSAARQALANQGYEMYGLASSYPATKFLKEAIPTCSNVFEAIDRHRDQQSSGDWRNTVLVIEDASRVPKDRFSHLIQMACEMGFAKVVLFFTNTFGFDLRAEPRFQALEDAGMPVLTMTQIRRA